MRVQLPPHATSLGHPPYLLLRVQVGATMALSVLWYSRQSARHALLKGAATLPAGSGAAEREDYEVVAPLWARPAMLRQLPPLTLEVGRACGC